MSTSRPWLIAAFFAMAQAQIPGPEQKLAAIQQAIAQNKARLRGYQWLETTEVSIKGELKSRRQSECRYGPDGTVIRTPVGSPSAPDKPGGLRGRIAKGKIEELQDYSERLGSLMSRYVPPDPERMQTSFQSGKASLSSSGDLVFKDYVKPGDQVTYAFDTASRRLRGFNVASYLDNAQDGVTLDVTLTALPDGANAVSESVIESKGKKLRVKRTETGHTKVVHK